MRLITDIEKTFISVVGLSSSGTTIVNNIFESMDNGFCISEPHWVLLTKPKKARFGKVGNLNYVNVPNIIPAIKEKLFNSLYDFGGIKETYRPFEARMKPIYELMLNQSNIVIFVFRNPIYLLNSYKAKNGVRASTGYFMKNYKVLYQTMRSYNKNKICIISERLCQAGNNGVIEYLNRQLMDCLRLGTVLN